MLQLLFRASGSLAMRALFGILLVAFIIFGIGDVFRNRGTGGDVAVVGKQHITPDDLNKAIEQQARQFGGRVDVATLKKVGFADHVLSGMIDDILLELAAHDEGFMVGNKQAVEEIEKIPLFQDEKTKALDRERFERVLAANQINEAEFVTYLKRQTATKLLVDSELAPLPVPALLVDASYKFENETRSGRMLQIRNADMIVAEPTQDQLNDTYHKHEAQFTAPEYRDFSFLYLDIASFADKVAISPAELKQAFETRQGDFTVPERREISQAVFKDQAKANAVADAAQSGKSLAAGLKTAGASEQPMDLGLMSKQDLPDILQGPIFAAQAGATLNPIQSPLGWHVIMVKRIEAGHPLSFEEAKVALEADLKGEKARDLLAQATKQVDDQLAGGASLRDAGKTAGIAPVTVKAVDGQGKHEDGTPAPEVHGKPELLKAVFAAEKDAAAQMRQEGKDSAFGFTVDAIIPPALRPLDAVKPKVSEMYLSEAKAKAASDKATGLIAKSKTGEMFAPLSGEAGAIATPIDTIVRTVKNKSIPAQVVQVLFNLTQIGDLGEATTPEGPVLVTLNAINMPPAQSADDKAVMEKSLQTQVQNDFIAQYEMALRDLYPVTVDHELLKKMKD